MRLPTLLLSLIFLGSSLARAEGELMVMPASLKVYNNHEHMVNVRNVGDESLYLSITLQKVINPGIEPEEKLAMSQIDHPTLLASPDKLTLGPGQSRSISLKSLVEPSVEALYRLYIVPVRAMQVENAPKDKITAPMSVSVGYGVLIRHMPPPALQRTGWTHHCAGGGVSLENTGNVRMVLSDVAVGSHLPIRSKVALFPGTPQLFAGKHVSLSISDVQQTLDCN